MKQSSGETSREDAKVCLRRKREPKERQCYPETPSLRAQRSNPESFRGGILDRFAALAMTMLKQVCPKTQSHAPDAAQRYFGGALQSRGPCCSDGCGFLGPGSAQQREEALQRVWDTGESAYRYRASSALA
jgi:hypothetical protein